MTDPRPSRLKSGLKLVLCGIMGFAGASQAIALPKFRHLQGGTVNAVFFLNSQLGWTAEDGTRIRYTQDGGQTWEYAEITAPAVDARVELRGVFFLDAHTGWAVGDNGVILQTVPSTQGIEWIDANPFSRITDSRTSPPPCGQNKAMLFDIFMFDSNTGWVVGNDGVIRTTGNNWLSNSTPASIPGEFTCSADPDDAYDVHFFADSGYANGIIAADYRKIWTTTDSGATWARQFAQGPSGGQPFCPPLDPVLPVELWSMSFDDPASSTSGGWIAGGIGFNQGYTFRTASAIAGPWEQVKCFDFLDPFASPVPGVTNTISTPYGVAALGAGLPGLAITVGYGNQVFSYQLGAANYDPCLPVPGNPCGVNVPTWVQQDASRGLAADPCSPQPALFAAAKISATESFLAGQFGRLARYTHGASPALVEKGTLHATRLNDGAFISATTGCVIGQGYTIRRTTNAAATWTNPTVSWACAPSQQGNSIDFAQSGLIGIAVGSGGFAARSTDGGVTWTQFSLPGGPPDLNVVRFVRGLLQYGEPTVYVAGNNGVVYTSSDDGLTWTQATSVPGGPSLLGISLALPNRGYVVGANETVSFTSNGGATWSAVTVQGATPGETFFDVATWGDGTPALLVGQNGSVYEKTGIRFNKLTLPGITASGNLYDVEVLDSGATVRIGGDNGLALFRDAGTWTSPRTETNNLLVKLAFDAAGHGFAIGRGFLVAEYAP